MAKDDYHVIAYRILAYLYICLKAGEDIDMQSIQAEELHINQRYWEYIMRHLYQEGYIEGLYLVPVIGKEEKGVKITRALMITPAGIDFLESNSAMSRAREFLKTLKETIPGL